MAFIISDTHFFHDKIIGFQRNQFKTSEEMNEYIIQQWNNIIGKTDRVFHLGDFAFGENLKGIEEIIQRLNGRIYLIIGNHDTPTKLQIYSKYMKLFSGYKDGEILMTHVPVHNSILEEYAPRSYGHNERYNIHGHLHKSIVKDNRYFNANWDIENKIYTLPEIKQKLIIKGEINICK